MDTGLRDEITQQPYPPKETPILVVRRGGREIDIKLYGKTETYTFRPGTHAWAVKGERSRYDTNVRIRFKTPEGQEIAWPPHKQEND